MNSWEPCIGVFLLLFVGRPILLVVLVFSRIRRFRLTAPREETIAREATPPGLAAVYGSEEADLIALGFQFERAVMHTPREGELHKAPAWLYVNTQSSVRVRVRQLAVDNGAIPRYAFESLLEGGRLVMTGTNAETAWSTSNRIQKKLGESPIGALYQAHLDFVESHREGRRNLLLAPDAREAELRRIWLESMLELAARGRVVQLEDGIFRHTAWKAFLRAIDASRRVKKLKANKTTKAAVNKIAATRPAPPSTAEEVEDYEKITRQSANGSMGATTKLIMLVVSLGLFVMAFRMSVSWQTVFILLGVLSFHEGGHLLGMRIFGYKGLQMLYLPFLGAVAIGGKRNYVKPWQELVMLFMGPLPGLFIGLFLLTDPTLFQSFPAHHQLVLMLLVLNLFNLLPLHPLDGGQIWDIIMFRRFPFARVIFLGLGATALFVSGVTHLFGTGFVVFGALLLLQLPKQWRQAKLIGALNQEFGAPLSRQGEAALLPAIFGFIRKMGFKFKRAPRIAFVTSVLAQCKADPANPATMLFGLAAYTSPLWVALVMVTAQRLHSDAKSVAEIAEARTEGLLVLPPAPKASDGVDGTPLLAQLQEIVKKGDVDLKFQAIARHVMEPSPDWLALHKSITDPDVAAVLTLARKVAVADHVTENFREAGTMRDVTRWLGISAECAAGNDDAATAWQDLEDAFRSNSVRMNLATSYLSAPDASLIETLTAMQEVMLHVSPSRDEINRLRGLLAAGRLARPILESRLVTMIGVVEQMQQVRQFRKNWSVSLLTLLAPHTGLYELNYIPGIRQIKQRLQIAEANPNAPEESVFGGSGVGYSVESSVLLPPIRLAKSALAVEEYWLAHAQLPVALTDVAALTDGQRNSITWDRKASQLKAKQSSLSSQLASLRDEADENDDDDDDDDAPYDGKYSPFVWNIRPADERSPGAPLSAAVTSSSATDIQVP